MRGKRWPSLTSLPDADTIRSVGSGADTYDHPWLSVPVICLALAGTHTTCCTPFRSFRIQLPASLPLGRFCYPPLSGAGDRPQAVPRHRGTMKALTPAAVTRAGRSLRLLRLAVPTFRPRPRDGPAGRFHSHLSADGRFQASPHMSRLAEPPRRNGFVILRTAGSPRVAPHPASRRRSYLRLRSRDLLRCGLAPH